MENVLALLHAALREGILCNIERAEELGRQARSLISSFNLKFPKEYRYFFCKRCKRFLVPGKTMRVRLRTNRHPHIAITCMRCHAIKRIPIKTRK